MDYDTLTDAAEWLDAATEGAKSGRIESAIDTFNEYLADFKQGVVDFARKYELPENNEVNSLISQYEQFLSNPEKIEILPEERLKLIRVIMQWFEGNKEKLTEITRLVDKDGIVRNRPFI